MKSRTQRFVVALLVVLALGSIACGGDGEQVNEAAEAEYAWLVENQEKLNDLRQEVADLRARAEAEPAEGEEEEGDEGEGEESESEAGDEGVSLEQQITEAEGRMLAASEEFNQRIAAYFNDVDPMMEGDLPNEKQSAVIRMKSGEDMVIAAEYIEQGGDYRRAIRIYEDALQLDPENEELQAALARAEEMRFMTEERLAEVKKGMTQREVRDLLGPVNLRNIREYPERNVTAWFYPVDDQGAASAVWFRANRSGELAVYRTAFDQIKGRDEVAEEE